MIIFYIVFCANNNQIIILEMFLKFITYIQNVILSIEIVPIPKIYTFLLNHYLTMSGNSNLQTSIKQVPNYLLSLNKLTVGTNSSIFYFF